MLDISMKDAHVTNAEPKSDSKVLKHFNHRRPAFVDPEAFIDPELNQLFELTYFHENSDGSVPTGWHKLDNYSRSLPKVSDRIPESSTEDGDGASPESWNSTASGNDDSSDEDAAKDEPDVTRMNDESSEEDMPKGARVSFMIS
jgi:ubiquitin carboxyl-terminal hydrolase 4/11/15